MKYLCMGYHEENVWEKLSDSERKSLMDENMAYLKSMKEKGHWLTDAALQPAATAATLRFDAGKFRVTDGPFAETKEQLGGVCVLEATDLNHAIQLMSQMPCMRLGGSMEIRPINENIK